MATLRPGWKAEGKKRIALVMGGGGSLGAYEAGALIELMYALETLNSGLEKADRFEIDVISGASAGGMSAAMAARILMYDYPNGRADLYRAWVQDIRMARSAAGPGLLEDDPKQSNALLSKNIIRRIANAYLGAPARPGAAITPASFAPDVLRLRLTLTNVNGMDYTLQTASVKADAASFLTTRFSDVGEFEITGDPSPALWSGDQTGIRDCAIACGNFPIAFQPQGLLRQQQQYPKGPCQATEAPPYFPRELTFIDGGMFDNEPLGKAINAATDRDVEADGQPDPYRLFLMIHPNIARSDHRDGTGKPPAPVTPYSSSEFGILDQAGRLLDMLMTENAVSDWVRASEVNQIVKWRDEFVGLLSRIVAQTNVADPDALIAQLQALMTRIAEFKVRRTPGRTSAEYLARVGSVEKLVGSDPSLTGKRKIIFDQILFILDHVSELQEKRNLWFEVIGHDADLPLAGAQVMGFAGFFEETWRIYDYRRGRMDAWRALSGWSAEDNEQHPERAILGVYDREPAERQPTRSIEQPAVDGNNDYLELLPYWRQRTGIGDFPRVTWADISEDLRDDFIDRILDRVLATLHPGFAVSTLVRLFGKGRIADLLAGE